MKVPHLSRLLSMEIFMEPFRLLISKVRSPSHFVRSLASNLPWSIQEVREDRRGRGEMNLEVQGRAAGEEIFQETVTIFIV